METRTITIKKVYVNTEKKDGTKFKTPLVTIYFDTAKGERKASAFVGNNSPALDWKDGDEVTLDFEMNGEYLNFKAPREMDEVLKRLAWCEEQIKYLAGDREIKTYNTAKEIMSEKESKALIDSIPDNPVPPVEIDF